LHIKACIDDAELMVDRTYYGNKADMAVHALAAHYVAISPVGELARLDKKSEETVYSRQYSSIRRSAGAGFRVI
jgi:triphosphoribosyl-dephospho-CoA synthetase